MTQPITKSLLMAGSILMVGHGWIGSNAGEQSGFLEGNLKIVSMKEVELGDADEKSPAAARKASSVDYAKYPLLILRKDGKKEIAAVTADPEGHYRIELPPGDYILDAKGRAPQRVRAQPKPFSIISSQTAHVDMDIDTGIR